MPCTPKVDLKDKFKTGEKPTQQDFANLIDSFVETVNGIEPDDDGNIDIPNTSQTVQKNLDEHEKVIGDSTTAGHLILQDSIDDNAVNAITPKAVNALKATVESNASASEIVAESVITLNGDVEIVKKNVTTLSGRMDKFDEDCNNNTQALDEHENVIATNTTLGHLKLQNSIDDNTTNAVTPNAVNTLVTQINKNKDDIAALTINVGEDGGYIKNNMEALKKHIDTASSETVAGHVKLQNSIDNTITTALTPAAVKPLLDEVNTIKTALDTGESAAAVDLKLTTHESVIASETDYGHVKISHNLRDDVNTVPSSHATRVQIDAINRRIDTIPNAAKLVTTHAAIIGNSMQAGHVKVTDTYDLDCGDAVSSRAIDNAISGLVQQSTIDNLNTTIQNIQTQMAAMNTEINALKNR